MFGRASLCAEACCTAAKHKIAASAMTAIILQR
jgi:hypothetical protein